MSTADRFRAGKRLWSTADDRLLRRRYPNEPTAVLAAVLCRTLTATYNRAKTLCLAKSEAYLQSPSAGRLTPHDPRGASCRFPKGNVPANKGLRRPGFAPGRMKETQFKKGVRQGVALGLWKPVGTKRISKDGYREVKVNDDMPLQARWRAEHLVVWEAVHGRIPKGYALAFKNRDKNDIRLDNLELITRGENLRRNSIHNLPKPLAQTIHLLGALRRQIRKRARLEQHS